MVPVPGLVHGPPDLGVRRRGEGQKGEPNDPLGGSRANPAVSGALARLSGRGQSLPAEIALPMGQALGADLSGVRIHTGDEPAELARSVQATAFTHGADIYFGAGSYAPHTQSGQRLLAHELVHTKTGPGGGPGGSRGG